MSINRREGLRGEAVADVTPPTTPHPHTPAKPRHKLPVRERLAKVCPGVAQVCKKTGERQGTYIHLCLSLPP